MAALLDLVDDMVNLRTFGWRSLQREFRLMRCGWLAAIFRQAKTEGASKARPLLGYCSAVQKLKRKPP